MKGNVRSGSRALAEDYFTRRMFFRQYLPAVISAMTLVASDVADAVVVGNSIGLVGLAAMSFALPIFMVYNVIMHSFGLGGSIRFAGAMVKGEEEKAVQGFRGVVYCLVGIGLLIAVLGNVFIRPVIVFLGARSESQELFKTTETYVRLLLAAAPMFFISYSLGYYMRNGDLEKEASLCASIGNISDVALNVVLVLICRLGALGAGIATLAGVLITSVLELSLLRWRKTSLRLFPGKADFSGLWESFRKGFSSSVSYAYSMVYILICNNLLMRMSGARGVAVFDVIQNIGYFFTYLHGAVGQASQPILSTYQGEHNAEGCRTLERLGVRVALLVGLAAALVMSIIAPLVCRFFGVTDADAVALGTWAVRMFCLSTTLGGINALLVSFSLARGAELPAFISTTLRGAVVLIPVTILFSFFGERWFWVLYPVTECVALGLFLLYLRRFKRQKENDIAQERVYRAVLRELEDIGRVTKNIEGFCEQWNARMKQQYFVQMAVEEVCSSIIANGFADTDGHDMIEITLVAGEDGVFTLHVRDSAVAFDPFSMESADVKNDGDELDFNAVGMDVIKQRAKEFFYRRYQGFNTMVVKI